MAEWLVEPGIGAIRAALVEDGTIVEARMEFDGEPLRAGAVVDAQVGAPLGDGTRTAARVRSVDAVLRGRSPVPQGATVRAMVVREAIHEPGTVKPPQLAPVAPTTALADGPDLLARCRAGDAAVRVIDRHGPDRLEQVGWGELIDGAETGLLAFAGGLLRIALTPAMTVIDVDGSLPPATLAVAGAAAAARAIRLFDLGGSTGIDLPTSGDRAARAAAAAAADALLPRPFERTAVNGFGFLQIVRPRVRASLLEMVQGDRAGHAARVLLRAAERAAPGPARLVAAPAVLARIERRPDWIDALARARGGAIGLRPDESLAMSAGHVDLAR